MTATLRERKRQRTARRIVEVAVELFTQRGFDLVTADEIAEAAECSRRTLFRYFGTKEDILFGDVHERIAETRTALAETLPNEDPYAAAKEVGLPVLIRYLSGDTALPRACIDLWLRHPVPRARYLEISYEWERVLADYFAAARGVAAASDLESQLLAAALVGTIRAVMRVYARPGTDLHAALERAFTLLEEGVRPSGPQPRQRPAQLTAAAPLASTTTQASETW